MAGVMELKEGMLLCQSAGLARVGEPIMGMFCVGTCVLRRCYTTGIRTLAKWEAKKNELANFKRSRKTNNIEITNYEMNCGYVQKGDGCPSFCDLGYGIR